MATSYVVVHLADDGTLTVFGSAYGGTLDHDQADAIARRLGNELGGQAHVRQIVAS
jgi:hypothetical protein